MSNSAVGQVLKLVGFGLLALVISLFPGGLWSVLLVVNLKSNPALPWAVVVMALVLWLIWQYLAGKGWPHGTSAARQEHLRANRPQRNVFVLAITAGLFSIVALVGFWIVLFQLVKAPGNALPDFSQYPLLTVILVLVMAALVGGVMEEAGFRGYFQVALERKLSAPLAIVIAALVISPGHGLTQGFVWTTLLFYFLSDIMFGILAYLANSILPGIIVHSIGLLIFFCLVWPYDKTRLPVWQGGADIWFWIHVAQIFVFAALALWTFNRLAKVTTGTTTDKVE